MHGEFTNKPEKEVAITSYTRNQLIQARPIIIEGKSINNSQKRE
ncbi:hypothetical protein Xkoz_03150 [Xenorhabdus kozodoii]|uniref:Uncharacterized protein n=1 Tax=Xenorhabdus kozodoii TaxID=351676 RepID=A0A2D0L426_9GAMM|nr:hypothetical protein Xkoz_03150 [Xenorhabdus kozodoii]